MLTNGKQIAAARQLLGWSQTDLATRAGVSKPSVVRMEHDLNSVKYDIQESIKHAIEDNGVEFLESNGLRENRQDIKKYTGQDGFHRFYDDLYDVAATIGDEICLFNGNSENVSRWLGQEYQKMHVQRMEKIKNNFHYKIVVKEGDSVFFGADFCTYRWFPAELFNNRTIYIYGSKVAFVNFMDTDVSVLVIDQKELARSQRLFFNLAWEYIAKEPTK